MSQSSASHDNADPGAEVSRRRFGVLPLVSVAVLVVALVLVWLRLQDRQGLVDAGQDAEAAGRAAVTNMLSYDHETLDEDFAWVEMDGTDAFAEAFQASAEDVKEIAAATSARSTATIVRSGVHLEDDDSATLVVVADSEITKATGLPIKERWFVSLELVREDGRWLVDALDLL
jgi:Mce-associated membrane protein